MDTATKALAFWGLEGAGIELAARRENHVFRVTAQDGRVFALRLHRPGYQTRTATVSELQWMQALKHAGLAVPEPMPGRDGALICEHGGHLIDLLTWLPGRPLGANGQPLDLRDSQGTFRALGRAMAELHRQADEWRLPDGFERPSWDRDGLVGHAPLWGRFWDSPALDADRGALFVHARDVARDMLADRELDFGLIHADLIRENVLVDDTGLQLIDFDDCGFGFRLFDVATTLNKNHEEPENERMQAALIEGYSELRDLEWDLLPLFMMLRALTYVGWVEVRIDEPGSRMRRETFIRIAEDRVQAFLKTL